jgi:hypothetical protein
MSGNYSVGMRGRLEAALLPHHNYTSRTVRGARHKLTQPQSHSLDLVPANIIAISPDGKVLPSNRAIETSLGQDEWTRLSPLVALSSFLEPRDITGTYSLRANSDVRKPVEFAQFAGVIRQVAWYWLLLNEHPVQRQKD